MNAVTGVAIMTQAITDIIIIVINGYPLIILAINPLLLVCFSTLHQVLRGITARLLDGFSTTGGKIFCP
jgi:hypothetical protein